MNNVKYQEIDYDELLEPVRFSFALDRRSFVQMLGAGVLITAVGAPALGQRRGRGRGGFRGGAAAIRELFIQHAAKQWNVESSAIESRDGKIIHAPSNHSLSYAEAAKDE